MIDPWGVYDGFHDNDQVWHPTSPAARAALHLAFGASGEGPPPAPGMWFTRVGSSNTLWSPADLVLDDGTTLTDLSALPTDLPVGLHWLHPHDGWPAVQVVRAPLLCPPAPARDWVVAAQVYALRSARSWGIGDLGDVRRLGEALGQPILCSPFHGGAPTAPLQPSPYYAGTRLFRDVLLLDVSAVDGAGELGDELTTAARAGEALNGRRLIDRDRVLALKVPALRAVHRRQAARLNDDDALSRYRAAHPHVAAFATFCALTAEHGRNWRSWPAELRRPDSPAVAAAAARLRSEVEFHVWCQWQLDLQVAAAAGTGLIGDLAVGFDPAGFDAWLFQDLLADGVRVGAPGDDFNPDGQDWGIAPFVPWKLRQARYGPLLDGLAAAFAHARAIRIDHVLGLFRLFCIPPGVDAQHGAYAAYASSELLDLVAVAATKAGAYVVGEDLGTVPASVSAALTERGILGCVVAGFEEEGPESWGHARLATVTTHDLPTTAGLLGGYDHQQRVRLGLRSPDEPDELADRLAALGDVTRPSVAAADVAAVYRAVAASPCQLMAVTTDDLAGSTEPPNIPGTIDEWPNWRIALPVTVEDLPRHPMARAIIAAVEAGRAELGTPTRTDGGKSSPARTTAGVVTDDGAREHAPSAE